MNNYSELIRQIEQLEAKRQTLWASYCQVRDKKEQLETQIKAKLEQDGKQIIVYIDGSPMRLFTWSNQLGIEPIKVFN